MTNAFWLHNYNYDANNNSKLVQYLSRSGHHIGDIEAYNRKQDVHHELKWKMSKKCCNLHAEWVIWNCSKVIYYPFIIIIQVRSS
jgi:hypothetical protein